MIAKFRLPLLALLSSVAAPLWSQHDPPPDRKSLRPGVVVNLAQAERLFQAQCAPCHGLRGEGGRGPPLALPVLPRAPDDERLLRLIRRGIPGTEMPGFGTRLEADQLQPIVAWVRKLGKLPPEVVPGEAAHGERLYRDKGACAVCHAIRGRGAAVGPELTDIGLRRGAAYLRTALTHPSADMPQSVETYRSDVSIAAGFTQVRAVAKDGRSVFGVRVNEDTFSIQIRDLANRLHSFFKSELVELHKDRGQSPMPSYAGALSGPELDDLVAYLVSLKGNL